MVLLLLPAVAHIAGRPAIAGTCIIVDVILGLPVEAGLSYTVLTSGS